MMSLVIFDILLALGLTLRLTRLIVVDDAGLWFVRMPVFHWAEKHDPQGRGWQGKLNTGLDCPFCIGFWIGCGVLLSLYLAGGPGDVTEAWRWVAGAFTLNWVAAHVGSRMGDS
jgi:hypothetical protein